MPKNTSRKEPKNKAHNAKTSIAEYVQAIEEANGLIAVAARRLGVTRQAIYSVRARSAKVREALDNARETTKDLAEGKLYSKINEGDIVAILFYLKTQAKDRGYVEKQEHEQTGDVKVTVAYEQQPPPIEQNNELSQE